MIARKTLSPMSTLQVAPPEHKATAAEMNAQETHVNEQVYAVEQWISLTLRLGVGLSLLLLIIGTIITFRHHPDYGSQPDRLTEMMRPDAAFPHSIAALTSALDHGQGQAIVTLGLLVLIATPIVRVGISTLAFWHERDWPFTFITLFVLGLLLLSMGLGRVHG